MTPSRIISVAAAINEALAEALAFDPMVICYGLGVPDPKGVFGTTLGLQSRFGKRRVFDMPTSENAMTGVAIGAALEGLRPVMVHQRMDFFLLAMDQLVNSAAKWHYTYNGRFSVPLTIRLIIGRGWGQGPTHSQSLQAWFTHVPGIKVVMPVFPGDAKGLLLSSIYDDNPVVFIEHRWLHGMEGFVPEGDWRVPLGKAAKVRSGDHVTIIGMSFMVVEAMRAADCLVRQGIRCDLIDLRTLAPMDWATLMESVARTGRVLVLDTGWATGSVAGEIVARISMECWDCLQCAPRRLALPDYPVPASPVLSKMFYPTAVDVARTVGEMLSRKVDLKELELDPELPSDIPGPWFKGPF